MRWAFFGGVAGLTFAGCTLLVDTSDLAGGPGPSAEGGKRDARVSPPPDEASAGGDAGDASSESDGDAGAGACPPDALLCTGFENGLEPLVRHADYGSTAEIVTDVVHGGTHAFRATSLARDGGLSNAAEVQLPLAKTLAPGDTIYWRAYVYFPARLPTDTTISKWRSSGSEDMNLKIDSLGRYRIDSDLATEGPELSGLTVAPLETWMCVDWRATFGAPGHQLLNLDGVKQIDNDDNNISANGYVSIGFGFINAETKVTEVVLYDDVVVSTSPIACP